MNNIAKVSAKRVTSSQKFSPANAMSSFRRIVTINEMARVMRQKAQLFAEQQQQPKMALQG